MERKTLQFRTRRQRGAEALEFTLVLLPFLAMLLALFDMAWAVFVKSTLQTAVRAGVRYGITVTAAQAPQGSCLTDMVKTTVQQNSMGLLAGSWGLNFIKVNYFQPPPASSTSPATDVSTQANGNAPGNIMQVSVQNFMLNPFIPRLFNWKQSPDDNATAITVYSADLIEPSRNPPCIGTAP